MTVGEAVTTVCEIYGYRLHNFYGRSFRDGGVTLGQLTVLFEHAQKRIMDRNKFHAAIHGVETKGTPAKNQEQKPNGFIFGDPKDYENIPMKEREAMTDKMMGAHKRWGQSPLGKTMKGRIKWE
uniref:Uncharacterized protein n=1 Tax=viral metagenome TaxID=1070528 RepID=A0A6M3IH48_9ZZZZ